MENLLSSANWRFVVATDGNAQGRSITEEPEAALRIEHGAYAEGSRWEQDVTGVPAGRLLSLTGRVHLQGPCLRQIGDNRYVAGAKMVLDALGEDSLGAAEHVFYPPVDPDGAPSESAVVAGSLILVVPEGAEVVRVRLELAGQGIAAFSGLALTAETADAGRMNDRLVDQIQAEGHVRSPQVERAFRRVPRHPFLPGRNWGQVYRDEAIPTHFAAGTGEAISSSSQPAMMAIMLEQLQVAPGTRVLEVGTGTGYNAALLAQLTGREENVWTVDITEEFCAEARAHLRAAGISGVHVVCADGWDGWPEAAPYDRVLVTASAHDIAPAWFTQLRDGGRLVLPWGLPNAQQRSLAFCKEGGRLVMEDQRFCGFMPLRGAREWSSPPGTVDRNWKAWLFPGQPEGDPVSLFAYPLGTAPAPGIGQHLIQQTWFEYLAAWA